MCMWQQHFTMIDPMFGSDVRWHWGTGPHTFFGTSRCLARRPTYCSPCNSKNVVLHFDERRQSWNSAAHTHTHGVQQTICGSEVSNSLTSFMKPFFNKRLIGRNQV